MTNDGGNSADARRKPHNRTKVRACAIGADALHGDKAVVLLDCTESRAELEQFERSCLADHRSKPFVLTLSHPHRSTPMNPLGGCHEPEVLARLLEALTPCANEGESTFDTLVADAILSVERHLTLSVLRSYLERGPDALIVTLEAQARTTENRVDGHGPIEALHQFCERSRATAARRIAALVPLLVMLCAGEWGRLLSPALDSEPLTPPRIAAESSALYLGIPSCLGWRTAKAIEGICTAAFSAFPNIELLTRAHPTE